MSALAVEKTANLSLRTTVLDKLVADEDSEFTWFKQLTHGAARANV